MTDAAPGPGSVDWAAIYIAHGMIPRWQRVWSNGVDISDQHPSTWGWPYSKYFAEGWRPYGWTDEREAELDDGAF